MNRIISFGLAVTAASLGPALYADRNHGRGSAAPHAPAVSVQRSFSAPSRVMPGRTFAQAPRASFSRSFVQPRSFHFRSRNAPPIAVGGSTANANRTFIQRNRSFANSANFAAPFSVSRDWRHDRNHSWHHHHFRWNGGDWAIIDPGFGYDYYYNYPAVGAYYDSGPSYDYAPAPPSSGSLEAEVQSALARDGYDPGPIDGVTGPQTREAIAQFQRDHGLPVTRRIDTGLLREMRL